MCVDLRNRHRGHYWGVYKLVSALGLCGLECPILLVVTVKIQRFWRYGVLRTFAKRIGQLGLRRMM